MRSSLLNANNSDLENLRLAAGERLAAFRMRGTQLDLTRGKPGQEQLDLSAPLLDLPGKGDFRSEDGADCRNYFGGVRGLPEARRLLAPLVGSMPQETVVFGNSSLALMHAALSFAMLQGLSCDGERDGPPWARGVDGADIAFICPVPGYDRHHGICEGLGVRMIPVQLTGSGPDMDIVEQLVRDPAVKGMWCVPQFSNPTGEIYSEEVVRRLASMCTAAPDFRIFWDNAYSVHDLVLDKLRVLNILTACAEAGHPDRAFVFGSTSKITFPGAGCAVFGASASNTAWLEKHLRRSTIGPDKLSQLRHVRFLKDQQGIATLMDAHRLILRPRFDAVLSAFKERLGGLEIASWSEPAGGYFIAVETMRGCARRVVALAAEAGVALTPAGAMHPYGRDEEDRWLRVAPSFPTVADNRIAAECLADCVVAAAAEKVLASRDPANGGGGEGDRVPK